MSRQDVRNQKALDDLSKGKQPKKQENLDYHQLLKNLILLKFPLMNVLKHFVSMTFSFYTKSWPSM